MLGSLALTALGVAPLPLFPVSAQGIRTDPGTIARAVDSLAARAVADGLAPALGVAITMDGRTIYMRSHGAADAAAGVPADDRTLWYVASTSKSFTGFGVALLVHQGALRMDAPITTLLPQARWHPAVRAESLTLAHFLSHTHRVNDNAVVSSAAFTGAIPEGRWPALIALAGPMPTDDLVYGNFGYNVAAMVIDVIRPEGWRRYLEQNVLLPAGMRETYARVSGLDPKRIAKPHRFRADGRYVTEPFFKTDATMNSAGGHLATLHDLARWTIVQTDSGVIDDRRIFPAEAVALSHRLIAKQTRDQAKRFAFFDREGWGAGWDVGAYEGERMVSRFGSYHTTRSHLSFLPGRRIGLVVMSSGGLSALTDIVAAFAYDLEAGRSDARGRAEERLAELRGRFAVSLRNVATQDSIRAARQRQPLGRPLADFAGVYEEPSFGRITFTIQNGRLEYRWGAVYGPVEIYDAAKGQLRIEIAGSGTVITFAFAGGGPARSLELQGVTFPRTTQWLPQTDSLERDRVVGALGARLDAQLTRFAEYGFWGTVLVVRDGQVALLKGYGLADASRSIPNTAATRFEMNSMTKMFTGAAVLQLEAAGRLHVSDSVDRYLGPFPAGKQGATIDQLASHTAGLVVVGTALADGSRDAFVRDVKRTPRESPPGQHYRYTNAGFSLLAAIIEVVSGESFEQYLERHLFAPAGMHSATFRDRLPHEDSLVAHGYVGTAAGLRPGPPNPYVWGTRGSGGVWATVGDIYRWLLAVEGENILPEAQRRLLFSPPRPPALEAYGWHVESTPEGRPLIQKGGGSDDFASHVLYYPGERVVIVWATNNLRLRWRQALNRVLPGIIFGGTVTSLPPVVSVPLPVLQSRAGRYVSGRDTLQLHTGPGYLYADVNRLEVPPNVMFFPQDLLHFTAFDPPSGKLTRLWFGQGNDSSVTVELADGRRVVARP